MVACGCGGIREGENAAGLSVKANVTVQRATTVGHISPGFVGLSYEKSHLTDAFFTGNNGPLIALCNLLGPGVLRIGGNSVDKTTWQPDATPVPPGMVGTGIGKVDVDNLAAFAATVGWKVIYGVNLKASTPAAAAEEAKYAASDLGDNLYAFEIGNEVDLYKQSYSTVRHSWEAAASAIKSAVPGAPLAGPATASVSHYSSWTVPFALDEASDLALLTQHYYRGNGKSPTATLNQLLAPDSNLLTMLQALSSATSSNHIANGYRLAEANSYFNHGAPGVSDTLGSALWAIEFLFISAQKGASGINFHGGGPGQDKAAGFVYTPIDELNSAVVGAKPIFYGMLLVTQAGSGNLLSTVTSAGSLNLTAYAVGLPEGSTNVVLVNKDANKAVVASVDVGVAVSSASAIFLTASSLTATSGVTLAGASISPTGEWNAQPPVALAVAGNVVTVTVAPASAALVRTR
jgi:hypothetical protein